MEKLFKVIIEDFKKEFNITKPLTARELKLIEVCYQRMVVKKQHLEEVNMTKDELITKQQLQIEEYEGMLKVNKELKSQIIGKFYNIGQPLNDNVLQMNEDQMRWCFEVVHLVEHLNYS